MACVFEAFSSRYLVEFSLNYCLVSIAASVSPATGLVVSALAAAEELSNQLAFQRTEYSTTSWSEHKAAML